MGLLRGHYWRLYKQNNKDGFGLSGANGSRLCLWLVSGLLTWGWTLHCPAIVLLSLYNFLFSAGWWTDCTAKLISSASLDAASAWACLFCISPNWNDGTLCQADTPNWNPRCFNVVLTPSGVQRTSWRERPPVGVSVPTFLDWGDFNEAFGWLEKRRSRNPCWADCVSALEQEVLVQRRILEEPG